MFENECLSTRTYKIQRLRGHIYLLICEPKQWMHYFLSVLQGFFEGFLFSANVVCTWNLTIHTWAVLLVFSKQFPSWWNRSKDIQQGAICRSLLANWMQDPPAVSTLYMCNLCLEPTAIINFLDLTVKRQYGCVLQEPQRTTQKKVVVLPFTCNNTPWWDASDNSSALTY